MEQRSFDKWRAREIKTLIDMTFAWFALPKRLAARPTSFSSKTAGDFKKLFTA
jgi:hypothetical protein